MVCKLFLSKVVKKKDFQLPGHTKSSCGPHLAHGLLFADAEALPYCRNAWSQLQIGFCHSPAGKPSMAPHYPQDKELILWLSYMVFHTPSPASLPSLLSFRPSPCCSHMDDYSYPPTLPFDLVSAIPSAFRILEGSSLPLKRSLRSRFPLWHLLQSPGRMDCHSRIVWSWAMFI